MIFLYRLRHLKPLPLSHAPISLAHAGVIDNEDLEERLWMNWNDCLVQMKHLMTFLFLKI